MHAKYSTLWIFWGLAGWKLRLRPLRFFYVQLKVSQTSHLIYVVLWAPRHDIAARCPSVYGTWQSQAVTHPIMNQARCCLTSVIEPTLMRQRRLLYIWLMVTHSSYWSLTHPTGHTPILLVTHPSFWSHTQSTDHTSILLVTHPSYWSHTHPTGHTSILLVTQPSYWSHTQPTGNTPILLGTHPSSLSHTRPTGHTPILMFTHKS